jgi:hypothetical protein
VADLIPPAVLEGRDVLAAQAVLDAWGVSDGAALVTVDRASLLELRGIIAVQLSDVRAAGIVEGRQAGRAERGHELAHLLRELLEDEGL